jgi:hypothetical protein
MPKKGKKPGFLSPEELAEYEDMRRRFNERIRWHERKWKYKYGETANVNLAYMQGALPLRVRIPGSKLKSRVMYNRLRDYMLESQTPAFKAKREAMYRESFEKLLDGAYLFTPMERKRAHAAIQSMTIDQIIEYQLVNHPEGMPTIYDKYKDHETSIGDYDIQAMVEANREVRNLEAFAKKANAKKKPKAKAKKARK